LVEGAGVVEELEKLFPGKVTRNVSSYLVDWWPIFWIDPGAKGEALAGIKPANIEDIVKLVRFSSSTGIQICVRGGGSSVTGASVPTGGVVLDMRGLNQILDLDEGNRSVTVQVGITLEELENKLNAKGFTLSQVPQSFDQATIGGFISTFGSGQFSTLYGGVEDSVLRLEVVLPSGEVTWTRRRGSPRSSMGPELSRLFIGGEGSFGIITAAELKIRRLPRYVWKMVYGFSSYENAINECRNLLEFDVKPAACRVYNETEALFQFGEQKCIALLVYHFGSKEVMDVITAQVAAEMSQKAETMEPRLVDVWLGRRFNYREEIENLKKTGYMPETVEIGAKWSRLYELYLEVMRRFKDREGVAGIGAHVSHLYDQGACMYFTFLMKPDVNVYRNIWSTMAEVARLHDATISHHHGVGALKYEYLQEEVPVSIIESLKRALDPERILQQPRSFRWAKS